MSRKQIVSRFKMYLVLLKCNTCRKPVSVSDSSCAAAACFRGHSDTETVSGGFLCTMDRHAAHYMNRLLRPERPLHRLQQLPGLKDTAHRKLFHQAGNVPPEGHEHIAVPVWMFDTVDAPVSQHFSEAQTQRGNLFLTDFSLLRFTDTLILRLNGDSGACPLQQITDMLMRPS